MMGVDQSDRTSASTGEPKPRRWLLWSPKPGHPGLKHDPPSHRVVRRVLGLSGRQFRIREKRARRSGQPSKAQLKRRFSRMVEGQARLELGPWPRITPAFYVHHIAGGMGNRDEARG